MITWNVTEQQADYIFKVLMQRPYGEVYALIANLGTQANTPPQPPVEPPPPVELSGLRRPMGPVRNTDPPTPAE